MKPNRKLVNEIIMIIAGDLFLAAAIAVFWEPARLVTGGVSGLGIIIRDYSGRAGLAVPLWLTNIVFNVPLFIAGYKLMGKEFLFKTAFAAGFLSAALFFASLLPRATDDLLLAAVFGGAAGGIGHGLVFRANATTGGTDIAASILNRRVFRHYSIARILFAVDSLVILAGLVAFGPTPAMYAVVAVFVSSKATDTLLEGLSFAKAVFIISDDSEKIAGAVMERMNRGATGLKGEGMFTRKEKNVLICAVSAKELVRLKEIVVEIDPRAFIMITDAREVLGRGFDA